jgi:hypothetical protein
MKMLITVTTGLFSVIAILILSSTGETASHKGTASDARFTVGTDGNLAVAESTSARVVGSLPGDGAGPVARFDSRAGKAKTIDTNVTTSGLSVQAKRDLQTQTLTVTTNNHRITAQEKRTLTKLCQEFEHSLGSLGSMLPQKEDLLLRTTCYLAEAPVGYKFEDITLRGPSAVYVQEAPSATATEAPAQVAQDDEIEFMNVSYQRGLRENGTDAPTTRECDRVQTLERSGKLGAGDFTMFVACQQSGENGIQEIKNCRPYSLNMYWDSRGSGAGNRVLCYGYRGTEGAGPCTRLCKGRCGIQCGNSKNGFYTRDCAEHDDCVQREDGPGILADDDNCGDEYREARDDFLRRFNRTCSNCNS